MSSVQNSYLCILILILIPACNQSRANFLLGVGELRGYLYICMFNSALRVHHHSLEISPLRGCWEILGLFVFFRLFFVMYLLL